MKKSIVCVVGGILLVSMLTACGGKESGKESVSKSVSVETEGDEVKHIVFDNTDYLDAYVKPTELGDDVTDTVLEMDGCLYQIPCPVSEFTDNGWKPYVFYLDMAEEDRDKEVELTEVTPAGEVRLMRLRKDGYECCVVSCNLSAADAPVSKCAVTAIYKNFTSFDTDVWPEGMIKFPGGLMETSTLKEVGEICKKFEETTKDDYTAPQYEYSGDEKGITYIGIAEINEEGEIEYSEDKEGIGFSMHNYNWEY